MTHGSKRRPARITVVLAAACALAMTGFVTPVLAQDTANPPQIRLDEKIIASVIDAQPDLRAFASRLDEPGAELTEAQEMELNELAAKHGFADYDALEDATSTISLVLAGIDRDTGEFTEPVEVLRQELVEIEADKDLDPEERKVLIEELQQAIASDPKIEHPENIELVRKFHKQLDEALQ